MNKVLLHIILVFFTLNSFSQISCIPEENRYFVPISGGVNFREKPNLDSKILYTTTNKENYYFYCVENGLNNDFVKLKIEFKKNYAEENGIPETFLGFYEHFKDSLKLDITLKSFVNSSKVEEKLYDYYKTILIKNDSLTFKYWSSIKESEETLDISTFDNFKKYFILSPTLQGYKIIEIYEEIGFVHKSKLDNSEDFVYFFFNDLGSKNQLEKLEYHLKLKNQNMCSFSENYLFHSFSNYILSLINEKKFFEAIKETNKYSVHFQSKKYNYVIESLKMLGSYNDKNYITTINIGKNLIKSHKTNLLPISDLSHSNFAQQIVNGFVDLPLVYELLIDSLIEKESYQLAYQYSLDCTKDKKLNYNNYMLDFGAILYHLGKKNESCDVFSKEYLNGNENAKEYIDYYCK